MRVKTEGGLFLKLSSPEREGLLEEGGLIEDLRYCHYCSFCLSDVKKKVKSVSVVYKAAVRNILSTLK